MKDFLEKYDEIICNIIKEKSIDKTVDIWDIIAAIFFASFLTVGALGISWIAYTIIISLSSDKIFTIGLGCLEWLKVKENRSKAVRYLDDFIRSNFSSFSSFSSFSHSNISSFSHSNIKSQLIHIFDKKLDGFDKMVMGI